MTIKIEMLKCFVTVAELGNLSDAAERLGRTPSAVSMSLKQLEDHLGAPLFESDRKNRLTTLGQFLLAEGRREVEQFSRCIETITAFARARIGIVRIGAVPSVAAGVLPGVIRDFVHDRPDVVIHLRDLDSPTILREVEMRRIDIGIGSTGDSVQTIRIRPLFADRFGVICNAEHPLSLTAHPLDWAELLPYRMISNASVSQISAPAFREMDDAVTLRILNTASVLGMVRAGVGITILPRLAIDGYERELRFLPLSDPTAKRRVNLLTRAQGDLPPVAQAFEEAIIQGIEGRFGREVESVVSI